MPNIFNGIQKMSVEQLSSQIASLEECTMSNTMSVIGQKAKKSTVKVFNGFRRLFNTEVIEEPKVVSIEERISRKQEELLLLSKEELESRMKKVLIEKMNSVNMTSGTDYSDDVISVSVIDIAAKSFKKEIPEELTPAQKADSIYNRYNEKLLAQTQKRYNDASSEQKKEINLKIQEEFENLPDEEKKQLMDALGVDKLTGDMVGKVLKTNGGAALLFGALNASGFGAYIALTTIIHAVFTTTLGITLPFATYTTATGLLSFLMGPGGLLIFSGFEAFMLIKNINKIIYNLLAQVVWSSVMMCGSRFTAKDENLPSWLPEDQRKAAQSDSAELVNAVKQDEELIKKYNDLKQKLSDNDTVINRNKQQIKELKARIVDTDALKKSLNSKVDSLQQNFDQAKTLLDEKQRIIDKLKDDESVSEEFQAEYNTAKENYDSAVKELTESKNLIEFLSQKNINLSSDLQDKEQLLNELSTEKLSLEKTNTEYENKINEYEIKIKKLSEKEGRKLEERWKDTFCNFKFEPGVIKQVVKNFEFNEFGRMERALMELHETKDPAAIAGNRGKMKNGSDEYHLQFSTKSGFPSRIFYKPIKNMPDGKRILITKICKHNDSRYGKRK